MSTCGVNSAESHAIQAKFIFQQRPEFFGSPSDHIHVSDTDSNNFFHHCQIQKVLHVFSNGIDDIIDPDIGFDDNDQARNGSVIDGRCYPSITFKLLRQGIGSRCVAN